MTGLLPGAGVLLLLVGCVTVIGYNVDVWEPIVRVPHDFNGNNAYFGYSVAQFQDSAASWMIVGSPRDNTSILSHLGVSRPGAIYKCAITADSLCEVIDVDTGFTYDDAPWVDEDPVVRDKLDNQWLGSSVAASKNGPIVACAHRYAVRGSHSRYYPIGRCAVLNQNFSVHYKLSTCRNSDLVGVRGTSFCQMGTSAQVSKGGDFIALGSPGAYTWQGIVHVVQSESAEVVSSKKNEGVEAFDYMGYATDIAWFGWSENYYIVVGAPRYQDYFGRVLIFEYMLDTDTEDLRLVMDGSQFGAYFGHSVVAADLDGDGYDDVVVGAPLFSHISYDEGRVYVYMNKGKSLLEQNRVLTGNVAGGRFGYAIANAGDLNGDSFDDVVISAPFGETGGVIYIYHGSLSGIKEPPSQTIEAESVNYDKKLQGFGAALSAGMDFDNNSYPDILVGAYISETVLLLRSKPVVDVEGIVSFDPQFVNYPDSKKFNVSFCVRYHGRHLPDELALNYNLSVEERRVTAGLIPRARFGGAGKTVINGIVIVLAGQMTCKTFMLQLLDGIRDKISPVVGRLSYKLQGSSDGTLPASDGNPEIRQKLAPVLRLQAVHTNSSQAYLLRDCGDDIQCTPDLQITSAQVNISEREGSVILLGDVSNILVITSVRNVKENAYNARLIATFPHELIFSGVVQLEENYVSCGPTRDVGKTLVVCDLGNPLRTGASVRFGIRMSVQGLTASTQSFFVLLKAVSDNQENMTTLADNEMQTDDIKIVAQVDFGIDGDALPDQLLFDPGNPSVDFSVSKKNEFEVGQQVNHSFFVINNGPASLRELELIIQWPWKVKDDTHLLYITNIKFPESVDCQTEDLVDPLGFLLAGENSSEPTATEGDSGATGRERRSYRMFRSVGRSTISKNYCTGSSYVLCIPIHCKLPHLDRGAIVEVHIISRLFERSLFQSKIFKLAVTSTATVHSTAKQNLDILDGLPKLFNLTTYITEPTGVSDEILQVWVIIAVVIATVLILGAAVALLACLGFFKRAKKDQLNKEKEEMELTEGKTKF